MFANACFQKLVDGTPLVVYALIAVDGDKSMYATILLRRASLSFDTNLHMGKLLASRTGFRYISSARLVLMLM